MKRFLFALGCLLLSQQVEAEYIESNVVIQIKVVNQKSSAINPPVTTYGTQASSLKTSDFIQLLAADLGKEFSSKARLLRIDPVLNVNASSYYVIREPGKEDVKIPYEPLRVDTVSHIVDNTSTEAVQGKSNSITKITNIKSSGPGKVSFFLSLSSIKMQITGPMQQIIRAMPSKQVENKSLILINFKISGIGSYDDSTALSNASNGYVQGTIKMGPPKVVPSL